MFLPDRERGRRFRFGEHLKASALLKMPGREEPEEAGGRLLLLEEEEGE